MQAQQRAFRKSQGSKCSRTPLTAQSPGLANQLTAGNGNGPYSLLPSTSPADGAGQGLPGMSCLLPGYLDRPAGRTEGRTPKGRAPAPPARADCASTRAGPGSRGLCPREHPPPRVLGAGLQPVCSLCLPTCHPGAEYCWGKGAPRSGPSVSRCEAEPPRAVATSLPWPVGPEWQPLGVGSANSSPGFF